LLSTPSAHGASWRAEEARRADVVSASIAAITELNLASLSPRVRLRRFCGTPDGGGASQPFLPGLAFFFGLEKGSNWLPQTQQLLS
jgi:hypothetical protein